MDDKAMDQLYKIRSEIIHGEFAFEIDRHPWGLAAQCKTAAFGEQRELAATS
jgi:hypothetical protein